MRRAARALCASLLGLAIAFAGLELGLRFLLFSDTGIARRLGGPWRNAEWYGDPHGEDEYWKLQHLFLDPVTRTPVPGPDPLCGWIGNLEPSTYAAPDAPDLRGRRPILLYGDSYAACTTTPSHCWQALLEQSDLGERFGLVNLGVGGYGLDQILLLLRASIDRWKDKDPIVVVSFLVDDDFHRTTLTFRGWPKRRFALEKGELVLSGPPILPPDAFVAEHRVGARSYLVRLLAFRGGFLPEAWRLRLRRAFDRRDEQIALGRRILEEIHAELAARKLTHFFLAFHGWDSLQPAPTTAWADELSVETAASIGAPLIGTRPYLLAAVGGDAAVAGPRLFEVRNGRFGHYNDLGNWVAFQAMRSGIEGRFGSDAMPPAADVCARPPFDSHVEKPGRVVDSTILGSPARIVLRGGSALARFSDVPYAPFNRAGDRAARKEYLLLRPGEDGPTTVSIAVPEGAVRLLGTATVVGRDRDASAASGLSVDVAVDGEGVVTIDPPPHPSETSFFVPVRGRRELRLVVSGADPSPTSPWVHLAGVRFSWTP